MPLLLQFWSESFQIAYRHYFQKSLHLACARRGDMAIFGALAPFAIFVWFGVKFRDILYYRSVDFSAYHLMTSQSLTRCVGMACVYAEINPNDHSYTYP